jgi:lipopolysaccharide transport system ATP-binding protein
VEPEILLLDEWLSVVDAQFSQKAEARMRDLVSRSRILVIASHNLPLLRRVCDTIVHLSKGKIDHIESVTQSAGLTA